MGDKITLDLENYNLFNGRMEKTRRLPCGGSVIAGDLVVIVPSPLIIV